MTEVCTSYSLKARARDFAPEKAAKAYLKLLGC